MDFRYLYIILLLLTSLRLQAQDYSQEKIDSLARIYYALPSADTMKLYLANDIANNHFNMDSIGMWADRLWELSVLQDNPRYQALAIRHKAYCKYIEGEYQESNTLYFKALGIIDDFDYNYQKADMYVGIGKNYAYIGDYYTSDDFLYKALDYYIPNGFVDEIPYVYRTLAVNYIDQRMFRKAEELLLKAIEIDSTSGNLYDLSFMYQDLGDLYLMEFMMERANPDSTLISRGMQSFLKSMELYYDEPYSIYSVCFSMGFLLYFQAVYFGTGDRSLSDYIDVMMVYYRDGANALEEMAEESESLLFSMCKVNLLTLMRKYSDAEQLLDSIGTVIDEAGDLYNDKRLYYYITADCHYRKRGDFEKAYRFNNDFYEYSNNLLSIDYTVDAAQSFAEADFREKERQRDIRDAERRIRNIWILVVMIVVVVSVGYGFYRKVQVNKILNKQNILLIQQKEEILSQKEEIQAQNDELFDKNEEITHQKEEISEQHRHITDSINYASLIQQAALPHDDYLKSLFPEYFLIYRPLNIVAGDFYWANRIGNYNVLVCADCTGHGVPGAFVSMLGISLLNEVSSMELSQEPAARLLDVLRAKLMKSLGQDKDLYERGHRSNMDGMDLAMIMLDPLTNICHYAGAYRPLWIWRGGQVMEIKPDKMPIGLYLGKDRCFTNHEIQLEKGDALYMFSDGIPDQFGYLDDSHESCKHFSTKRLLALIAEIGALPLAEQRLRIENEVDTWKNGYKQLDDNILIGVRV